MVTRATRVQYIYTIQASQNPGRTVDWPVVWVMKEIQSRRPPLKFKLMYKLEWCTSVHEGKKCAVFGDLEFTQNAYFMEEISIK